MRTFLRTYAQALGLDSKALVEEYRLRCDTGRGRASAGGIDDARARIVVAGRAPRPSRGYLIAMGAVGFVIVLLLSVSCPSKGGGPSTTNGTARHPHKAHPRTHGAFGANIPRECSARRGASACGPVAGTSAPVFVCLIDATGRRRIPGLIIQPPYTPLTYHSTRFEILLGNSAVTMYVRRQSLHRAAIEQADRLLDYHARAHTLAASASSRRADERRASRRHPDHRHGGADGPRARPQRPVAVRAAAASWASISRTR